MADAPGGSLKRPYVGDDENNAHKRPRSQQGSPAPTSRNGEGAPKIDIQKAIAAARAKAEAVRARLQAQTGASPAPMATSASPSPAPSSASPGLSKIEQMKARVAAATGRVNASSQQLKAQPPPLIPPAPMDEGLSRARGGLDVGLHPALLGDTGPDGRSARSKQAIQPKFATTMANRRTESPIPIAKGKQLDLSGPSIEETRNNPYFDPSLGTKTALARPRYSRQLIFNQKGKYIQQAAALRRQAQLEAMKKRIAERARQAGIDEDLDVEKAFLVPAPPAIEWWDEALVNGNDYSAIDDPNNLKIDSPDSVITVYIQHPVLLEPPQEKNIPPAKPMYLTPKEQAKIRRQRRMADLKEQQAKIRLGLEPAPPPKVKKSNLMRVLGEEAVKDPTAVEARVNREIAERAEKHMADNEARKLTKEGRHEKLAKQQEKDALKGIYVTVYRVDSLANGRHRFKISGYHSINAYKKLMLNRIDWTENAGPNAVREGNREALASWLAAEDEKTGELKDLSLNTCTLVWEGEEKTRAFRKWLGARVARLMRRAKDMLTRAKMESFWTLAKSMKPNMT
ncbi:conserved hypothetical protein [Uncinocarpus reesii 1704]|uniref:Uncharacterized protein n=1 Tax=Uncinocarpus reesii (strain UAMH 1704) TaxID=336963 RepID=C4JYF6_UNCRE|nr:uncharacterized protein UREG_07207 [Uncinocarpus reesii 1704]EEP82342.1 conserved hypothetical protein [Uncinocarpus reesii 1704]